MPDDPTLSQLTEDRLAAMEAQIAALEARVTALEAP